MICAGFASVWEIVINAAAKPRLILIHVLYAKEPEFVLTAKEAVKRRKLPITLFEYSHDRKYKYYSLFKYLQIDKESVST